MDWFTETEDKRVAEIIPFIKSDDKPSSFATALEMIKFCTKTFWHKYWWIRLQHKETYRAELGAIGGITGRSVEYLLL